MAITIRRWSDHTETPWRNGAGTSYEVARKSADSDVPFDWRLSFASVSGSGPFSAYQGIDRIIMLVRGGTMTLTVGDADATHVLGRHEPFAFPGEADVTCEISEPSLDFNVMVRRDWGRASASVLVLDSDPLVLDPDADANWLVVLQGDVRVGVRDEPQDELGPLAATTWSETPLRVRALSSDAVVAVVRISANA